MSEKKITPSSPGGPPRETDQPDADATTGRNTGASSHKFRTAARKAARKTGLSRNWSDRALKGNVVAVTW